MTPRRSSILVGALIALCLFLAAPLASQDEVSLEPTDGRVSNDDSGVLASPEPSPSPRLEEQERPTSTPIAEPSPGYDFETRFGQISTKLDKAMEKIDAVSSQIERLREELSLKLDGLAKLGGTLKSVESDYLDSEALSPWKTLDVSEFGTSLISGFSKGEGKVGTWVLSPDGQKIAQTDGRAFFAKYRMPLAQNQDKLMLFSFKAGSTSKDTVGLGLHFGVSAMPAKAKESAYWGEGKSILVWFARDQRVKKNHDAYLQIYKSDSQVNLEKVFDSKMATGFTDMDDMRVDVLYDPMDSYILIQVNGSIRVVYKLPFTIPPGREIALRTVGSGVSFSDFSVKVVK